MGNKFDSKQKVRKVWIKIVNKEYSESENKYKS